MKNLLLLYTILYPLVSLGQINLVPNPSFEEGDCPNVNSYLNSANGNMFDVFYWSSPTNLVQSSDYFNNCSSYYSYQTPVNSFGEQNPNTGNAYSGIYPYIKESITREYIFVDLGEDNILKEDSLYHVGFYFSTSDIYKRITPSVGIHFYADTPIPTLMSLPYHSQYHINNVNCIDSLNTSNWILVEGEYVAKGDERFLAIGCFEEAAVIEETIIEDETSIGSATYLYIDDVFVTPFQKDDENSNDTTLVGIDEAHYSINLYPNPTYGLVNINIKSPNTEFELFNIIGESVEKHQLQKGNNSLRLKANIEGLYFYRITRNGILIKTDKLLIQ